MRLLFTTDLYAPHTQGGTEIVIQNIAERLVARGHTVAVVTLDSDGCPQREVLNGVEVRRFASLDLTPHTGLQASLCPAWPIWLNSVVAQFRPDVVNAQNLFFFTALPTLLAARRKAATVLTLQVHGLTGLPRWAQWLVWLYERTAGRVAVHAAAHTVCVGPAVGDYFRKLGGNSGKMSLIRNGVDARNFAPTPERTKSKVVLFVGRLVANKGPQVFVDAARLILGRGVDLEFWLVGDGPLRQSLEMSSAALPRIRFLGQRSDISDLMRQACMFVRPSMSEGLSLAMLEAMASGLPLVASDIPGNRDLVEDGQNGCLVPVDDAEATARAIEYLMEHPDLRQTLAARSRAKALNSTSWDGATDQLETLFASLV